MNSLLPTTELMLILCNFVLLTSIQLAPEGYEDEDGFHYGPCLADGN